MKTTQNIFPMHSLHFWKSYLVQMRPYLFFISGFAGLAGMAVFPDFALNQHYNLFAFIAFFFSYGFGQALTDCYQTDTDVLSAPYRPLSMGILSNQNVKIVSITGLVLVASVLVLHNWINIFLCLLSVIGLWTYTYFKKNFWFAGPFYNAWIVAVLVLIGYMASSEVKSLRTPHPVIFNVMIVTFFAYTNFVLVGYLKDISADSKTNYNTFPVVFGWVKTVWVADIILMICTCFYFIYFTHNWQAIAFGILSLMVAVSGQVYAHLTRDKTEKNAAFPILSTVRSFLLWHAGMICNFHPGLFLFCIVFYLLFEITVYFRPMQEQI